MTNEEYQQIKKNILDALDKAIARGDWEASLFFQNIGKRLIELRDHVNHELEVEEKLYDKQIVQQTVVRPGYCKVYISLHQADGENLERWHHTIKMLSEYSISRPIYAEEEHVRELIRNKADIKREGYVVASVPESAINPSNSSHILTDKFGHRLLSLREGSVKLDNVTEFVHLENRYRLVENKLVKQ